MVWVLLVLLIYYGGLNACSLVSIPSGSEIIGAIIIGRVLDNFQPEKRKSGATVVMYALFAVVLFSNVLAYSLEFPYAWTKPVKEIDYTSSSVLIPSLVFFLWGFSGNGSSMHGELLGSI